MCRALKVSRSGYYAWRPRPQSKRATANEELLELITKVHERSYGTYGSPRVHAELRLEHGVLCSRNRVERLVRVHGLQGVHRRRPRRRNGARVPHPIFDDLVAREFTADALNRLWVTDITQHWTSEGWLYLAVVLGSMGAVGCALDNAMAESFFASLQTELLDRKAWPTMDALKSAIFEYIEIFYNRRRRHSALEYRSPLEHERETLSLSAPQSDRLLAVH